MGRRIALVCVVFLLAGCVPKVGKDILIEPSTNIRLESSPDEVVLGVLALLGSPVGDGMIRIGTDITITNKWHSDVRVIALDYTLNEGNEVIAQGEVIKKDNISFVVVSGSKQIIPLQFRFEPKKIDSKRVLGIVQSKRKLLVKGRAVIKVWGIEREYPFEKEVTKLVQKALMGDG
ncbi:MAG: hypothetical protein IE884_05240 [Sulfuricurvum sp.]|nr:hypothetical protein [Sulfuricurvum sp.]